MSNSEVRVSAVATAVKNTSYRAGLVSAIAAATARSGLFTAVGALERGLLTSYEFACDLTDRELEAAESWMDFRSRRGLAA